MKSGSPKDREPEAGRLTFEALYQEWASYVYSLAYRLTGNKIDAEDLSQETFVRVYRFLKDFRGGSLKGWLYRIVMNTFYLKVEKEKKGPVLVDDEAFFVEQIPDESHNTPAEILKRREKARTVHQAIAALPPEYKTALVLADLEEMSYQAISEVLKVPIGTVRSRISRARMILKGKLIKEGQEI